VTRKIIGCDNARLAGAKYDPLCFAAHFQHSFAAGDLLHLHTGLDNAAAIGLNGYNGSCRPATAHGVPLAFSVIREVTFAS
jgi:hypothetical protein